MAVFRIAFATALTLAVVCFLIDGPSRGASPADAAGCWPKRPHSAGTSVESISTADGLRNYRLHVPSSYAGGSRVPLVLNFHGATSDAATQELYSGMSGLSDTAGFIVVYPEGTTLGSPYNHFNATQLPSPEPDEVAFVDALLDQLEASLCIDSARIFSTGLSNGAMISVRLACSLSDRIAAIAPVAGGYYPQLSLDFNPAETCGGTDPVPIRLFHGTADASAPFNGGPGGIPNVVSLTFRLPIDNTTPDEDVLADWAAHNGCTSGRQEVAVTGEVRYVAYGGCNEGADTELYIVDGGGHTWPGAFNVPQLGYTTHDISANMLMWQFFQAHPLAGVPESDLDGDTVPDSVDLDDDNDGCTDAAEQQTAPGSEQTGGRRSLKNPWDFFDANGDKVIGLFDDILEIARRFGLTPSDGGYSTAYDRSSPMPGEDLWEMHAPDGTIDLFTDIIGAAYQFGHDCS